MYRSVRFCTKNRTHIKSREKKILKNRIKSGKKKEEKTGTHFALIGVKREKKSFYSYESAKGERRLIRSIKEVYEKIHVGDRMITAVAQAADAHVLEAAVKAYEQGYIQPVLFGKEDSIRTIAEQENLNLQNIEICQADTPEDAALQAVSMVSDGQADILMKGQLDSAVFLKAVLNKEHGIRKSGAVISAIAVVELKKLHRLIFITDPGFTPLPDLKTKKSLIENAVEAAHLFEIEKPNVAVLSAAEKLNAKMISSVEAEKLQKMNESGEITGCRVAGPISFDLAVSEDSVRQKEYKNPVGGNADILLVPTLEVGNVLYKSLSLFADMETGGIMTGATAPIIFTSRADSVETKENTIALAVYMAQKKRRTNR